MVEDKDLIARWESLKGKHWIELWRDPWGYSYKGDNCGGALERFINNDAAIFRMHKLVADTWSVQKVRFKRFK